MKKYFYYSSFFLFTAFMLFAGCKKEDSFDPQEINRGPYVSRADSARIFSGRHRLLIAWPNNDPNVSTVKVYWNKHTDSLIQQVQPGSDSIKLFINNLQEGNYNLEVFTYDINNNNSGKVLFSGHAYGEVYTNKTDSIRMYNLTYTPDNSLIVDWTPLDTSILLGAELVYQDANGAEKTVFVNRATEESTIADILPDRRGTVKYRTLYAPTGRIIDTLFSAYTTVPYVNRQAVFDSLPGWKYRAKVFAEAQTVADFGGPIAFAAKMDSALLVSGKRFQVPGLNDAGNNDIHFYMTDFNEFTGASTQYTTQQWGADNSLDFVLVVNDHAASGDDSWGWRRAPFLTLGHDYAGIFTPNAIDALVHELGHFRGMYDLYLGEVTSDRNPINSRQYESVRGIMNSPYGGETVWSEFSRIIINASAGNKVAKPYWEFFPDVFRVNVRKRNNTPATGAQLRFYPVIQTSTGNVVRERGNDVIQFRATLGADGIYTFNPPNPFAVNQVPWNNMYNFLVEVTYTVSGTEYMEYAWMPMNDALIAGSKGLPYELRINLTR